jgi:hypothetical protein
VDAAADGVLDLIHFHRKMHRHLPVKNFAIFIEIQKICPF